MYVLVPCTLERGMFPTEYAAEITLHNGEKRHLFVDECTIVERDGASYLRTTELGSDQAIESGIAVVYPTWTEEEGRNLDRVASKGCIFVQ